MAGINFGGLASGMDTNSIIEQLMKLERRPIERLQREQSYLKTRLTAFTDFDKKLKDLLSKVEGLETASKLVANKATVGSEDYFKVSASAAAVRGSYNVEVVSLAQREKEVSEGYASTTEPAFGTGTLSLTVNGETVNVDIDETKNSMGGICDAINAADAGVRAAIINDGDATNPYRIILTADDSGQAISVNTAGLSGGSYANPVFTQKLEGTSAHIIVDGIDIYRDSNTISEAIPGVTIDLVKAHETAGATTGVQVDLDVTAVEKKVRDFVTAYNEIITFVGKQKDSSWGRDSGLQMPKRTLQSLISTQIEVSGNFEALAQLGLSTQKDGTLKVDSTMLTEAVRDDLDSVTKLFAGEGEVAGLASRFTDYLKGMTDRADGVLAGRKKTTEYAQRRLTSQIERQEARLEQREKALRAQFSAMEDLVSALGAQSTYLAQQMSMISNLGS